MVWARDFRVQRASGGTPRSANPVSGPRPPPGSAVPRGDGQGWRPCVRVEPERDCRHGGNAARSRKPAGRAWACPTGPPERRPGPTRGRPGRFHGPNPGGGRDLPFAGRIGRGFLSELPSEGPRGVRRARLRFPPPGSAPPEAPPGSLQRAPEAGVQRLSLGGGGVPRPGGAGRSRSAAVGGSGAARDQDLASQTRRPGHPPPRDRTREPEASLPDWDLRLCLWCEGDFPAAGDTRTEGEKQGASAARPGRGAGIHGVRGASGDVPARRPGFPPDLRPPRAPLAPPLLPPIMEESLHRQNRITSS